MDTLFDEVSRILAQPRPRRATLRLVVGTAAGALVSAWPGHAFAWQQCGGTSCKPGQTCCDSTGAGLCCDAGMSCLHDKTGLKVCCPAGSACGADLLCCLPGETCCTCGGVSRCCTSANQKCDTSSGVAVCADIAPQCVDAVCLASSPGFMCKGGKCVCDNAKCGMDIAGTCNSLGQCICDDTICGQRALIHPESKFTCGPIGPNGMKVCVPHAP
jgi:hypothetical protein